MTTTVDAQPQWTSWEKKRKLQSTGWMGPMSLVARVVLGTALFLLTGVAGQAASVKELFEARDLLGTWAIDCGAPASEQNPYTVYRPVETYVQRDTMAGPSERSDASVIDRAEATKPNEISMSMANTQRRLNMLLLIAPKRMRTVEIALESGEKLVAGGRLLGSDAELPWLNKCAP